MTSRVRPLAALSLSLAVALSAVACGDGGSAAPAAGAAQVSAVSMQEAKDLFTSLCSTCHGASGRGDGPGAAALDPKPRSFSDGAWQASVTDDHIRKVITLGGGAVGKSVAMPPQPQLKGKPEVLAGLVGIVRSYRN